MGWRRRDHYRESFAADPVRIAAIIAGVAADWLSFRRWRGFSLSSGEVRTWVGRRTGSLCCWIVATFGPRAMLSMIIHLLASETNK